MAAQSKISKYRGSLLHNHAIGKCNDGVMRNAQKVLNSKKTERVIIALTIKPEYVTPSNIAGRVMAANNGSLI